MLSTSTSFDFSSIEDQLILNIQEEVSDESTKEIENVLNQKMTKENSHLIINLNFRPSVSVIFLKFLAEVQKLILKNNSKLVLIQVSSEFKDFLKTNRLENVFATAPAAEDALVIIAHFVRKKMVAEFIKFFIDATLHVLNVQGGVTAEAGSFFVKKVNDHPVGDVSGIIGVISEDFNGSVVISFPEQTFLNIMSSMLGESMTVLSQDLLDGASEITNMIFGHAKVSLNERGHGVKMALPSVISGKGHTLSSFTKGTVLIIPYKSDAGDFFMEICLSV